MTSSGISGSLLGKLYTEFQVEEMKSVVSGEWDDGNPSNGDGCSC